MNNEFKIRNNKGLIIVEYLDTKLMIEEDLLEYGADFILNIIMTKFKEYNMSVSSAMEKEIFNVLVELKKDETIITYEKYIYS